MKRQQQYMTGFFKKLQEKVKANPNYANEVFESLQDVSTTDIAIGKISNISNIFASGTDKGIFEWQESLRLVRLLEMKWIIWNFMLTRKQWLAQCQNCLA